MSHRLHRDARPTEAQVLARRAAVRLSPEPICRLVKQLDSWHDESRREEKNLMNEPRKSPTGAAKVKIMDESNCYVCNDLGLDHAGFDGYAPNQVAFDHYQLAHGNVGAVEGAAGNDVLPIHAASGGSTADDPDYEHSTSRNCHRLRGNDFDTRHSYVGVLKARMAARNAEFIDDVYENSSRKPSGGQYKLPAKWKAGAAEFIGKDYVVISETRQKLTWSRFLTTLRGDQLFTDDTSQVRPAAKKALHKLLLTSC